MNFYLVVLAEGITPEVQAKADLLSGDSAYMLTEHSLLVRSWEDSPKSIRGALGIDESRTGVVFKLNGSYSGHYSSNLWAWLREGEQVTL